MSATEISVTRVGRLEPIPIARPNQAADLPSRTLDGRGAFDALVREHQPALEAFAVRLCGSSADARDLVQDTHERAFRHFDTFSAGSNARAWLFTILHRAFIDRCRRRTAEGHFECIDDVQVPAPEPADTPRWASVSREQLESAIAELDEEFRAVYRLHAVESLSYQEISQRLGIPQNTVGTRLSRARQKLRAILESVVPS